MRDQHGLLVALTVFISCLACRMYVGHSARNFAFDAGDGGSGPALAIFGDSLSTGVLASTKFGVPISGQLLDRLNRVALSGRFSIAFYQSQFSEYQNSAMTTDLAWGVRARIAERHQLKAKDIPFYLFARWGGRTDHLDEFITAMEETYRQKKPPSYVLVEIGGNDFCAAKTAERFARDYRQFLDKILAYHPQATILVGTIPPLPQLLNYQVSYSRALSCEFFRNKFCKRLSFKDAIEEFDKFNAVIKEQVGRSRCERGNIYLTEGPSHMELTKVDIAFDCFHPSLEGQKKLAKFFHAILP